MKLVPFRSRPITAGEGDDRFALILGWAVMEAVYLISAVLLVLACAAVW